jgi:hypothetical protein
MSVLRIPSIYCIRCSINRFPRDSFVLEMRVAVCETTALCFLLINCKLSL